MIVTLHFVQQPVLDHSGAQVQAARCILILSFYDDDDYTGIDSFISGCRDNDFGLGSTNELVNT